MINLIRMFPPNKIACPSDDTELVLSKTVKTKEMKEPVYFYEYTKSNLVGMFKMPLPLPDSQLKKSLENGTFKEIQ